MRRPAAPHTQSPCADVHRFLHTPAPASGRQVEAPDSPAAPALAPFSALRSQIPLPCCPEWWCGPAAIHGAKRSPTSSPRRQSAAPFLYAVLPLRPTTCPLRARLICPRCCSCSSELGRPVPCTSQTARGMRLTLNCQSGWKLRCRYRWILAVVGKRFALATLQSDLRLCTVSVVIIGSPT